MSSERPSTPSSLAIHSNSEARRDGKDFCGDTAFRRPYAAGTRSEPGLHEIESAQQLRLRIFGMAKTDSWKRDAWIGDAARLGIAEQRQNGMVKGTG